jgi:hypothetical protein
MISIHRVLTFKQYVASNRIAMLNSSLSQKLAFALWLFKDKRPNPSLLALGRFIP